MMGTQEIRIRTISIVLSRYELARRRQEKVALTDKMIYLSTTGDRAFVAD
jgi:hypothetical protein